MKYRKERNEWKIPAGGDAPGRTVDSLRKEMSATKHIKVLSKEWRREGAQYDQPSDL